MWHLEKIQQMNKNLDTSSNQEARGDITDLLLKEISLVKRLIQEIQEDLSKTKSAPKMEGS